MPALAVGRNPTLTPELLDEKAVLRELQNFCKEQGPGAVVPSHTAWMQRLGTTERSVRWALAELQRQGRILRRQGARTLVAPGNFDGEPALMSVNINHRTVVAIASPDGSFFDRGVELLFSQTQDVGLSYVFRPHQPGEIHELPEESPLGYLIFGLQLLPLAVKLQAKGKRVVVLGTPAQGTSLQVPHVQGDQERGGFLAAKHLIDLGHHRLSFWGSDTANLTQRFAGVERAVFEARRTGLEIQVSVREIDWELWRAEPKTLTSALAKPDAPTGIMVWNDHQAVQLLSLFAYLGIRVPEQMSVIGYDNLPTSQSSHPRLSTVDGGLEMQLQEALAVLNSNTLVPPNHTVIVPPSLIPRDSTVRAQ